MAWHGHFLDICWWFLPNSHTYHVYMLVRLNMSLQQSLYWNPNICVWSYCGRVFVLTFLIFNAITNSHPTPHITIMDNSLLTWQRSCVVGGGARGSDPGTTGCHHWATPGDVSERAARAPAASTAASAGGQSQRASRAGIRHTADFYRPSWMWISHILIPYTSCEMCFHYYSKVWDW